MEAKFIFKDCIFKIKLFLVCFNTPAKSRALYLLFSLCILEEGATSKIVNIKGYILSLGFKNKTHNSLTGTSALPFLYCGILELDNCAVFLFSEGIKIDTPQVLFHSV